MGSGSGGRSLDDSDVDDAEWQEFIRKNYPELLEDL